MRRSRWWSNSSWAWAAALAVGVFMAISGVARAQISATPAPGLATTDVDEAWAVGPGNTLLAGGWSRFAADTGHWLVFDGEGAVDARWPYVSGYVSASAPDGAGGWYIAGRFTYVGDESRPSLAHVGADGRLDTAWAPGALDAVVDAIMVHGRTVYVGGDFTSIGGQRRSHLAALNGVTGQLLPWNPQVDYAVEALAVAGGTIVAGGHFERAGEVRRRALAAFEIGSAALTPWDPGVGGKEATVNALVVDEGKLFVAGDFTSVRGQERDGLASYELATGALTSWAPALDYAGANTLAVSGETVYIGGEFESIGGQPRVSLGAVHAQTGAPLPWRADVLGTENWVWQMALAGDRLYIGGSFESVGGQPRQNLAAVSAATGAPIAWDSRPNELVWSLAANGPQVVVGGSFYATGHQTHDGVTAIDLETGTPWQFSPGFPESGGVHVEVTALAAHGDTIFAAGSCAGRTCRRSRYLGRSDPQNATMRRWNHLAGKQGEYYALAVHGDRLYVGGYFRRIGGRKRSGLAAIDTRTGRVTSWRADVGRGAVFDLQVDGETLFVSGGFDHVAGRRRHGAAAINLRTGRVTDWNPRLSPSAIVDALAVTDKRVYLAGNIIEREDSAERALRP